MTSTLASSPSRNGSNGLVFYVTSHGFGHLNRAVAVINRLPAPIPVAIRCAADLFPHWRERLIRPADLGEFVSDSGACHPPGESHATDGPETIARAIAAHDRALEKIDDEAAWLKDRDPAAIVCDAPPLPMTIAERAGVASFVLANFDWRDIYAPHAQRISAEAVAFVNRLGGYYRKATALLLARPSLAMRGYRRRIDLGLVVNPGRDRRRELRSALGLSDRERLVYAYLGRYGQDRTAEDWDRIARLERLGIHFVGFHKPPGDAPANLRVVDPNHWIGADLALSADLLFAKAGYGTVTEAMAARVPMIYPPRLGFAEHRALDRALKVWGGGVPIPTRDYQRFRVERWINQALQLQPGPPPCPVDGAERAASFLTDHCRYRTSG